MTATIAQTVAGIVFCPIDIVKQRVQTASVMGGGGGADAAALRITPSQAAREVWTHQGVKGFFRGYWTMNALWMPWNLIYLSTYEAAKRRIYRWQLGKLRAERIAAGGSASYQHNSSSSSNVSVVKDLPMSQVLPVWAFPACSSSCAALAAVCTHPLDVVKTRLQVLTAAEKGQKRRSAWQVAGELWAAEGMKGFTRGAGARIATLSVGSSTSWFCYEMVKRQLETNFPWREEEDF
jgi:solute carrier family 25 citrate transporter 1